MFSSCEVFTAAEFESFSLEKSLISQLMLQNKSTHVVGSYFEVYGVPDALNMRLKR